MAVICKKEYERKNFGSRRAKRGDKVMNWRLKIPVSTNVKYEEFGDIKEGIFV